jgi:outer membrane receptor protein involved in Fe transport
MVMVDPLNGFGRERLPQFPKRALAVAVSAACGVASAAEQGVIEEIIVTATKRSENLQDVPMSITAFTDEDIVKRGFKQLDDYVGSIPSLSFARREPAGNNVVMRGCAVSGVAFSDNPTTAVYLDEQPVTVAGFNPDPRLVDIERLEALSGPQGTLFGDASQCGTLRIITNKPDTSGFDGYVDITGSSVKDGGEGYDLNGMVNIPLIEDKLALRLVGFYAEEPGWVDNVLGTSPGGTFNNAPWTDDDVNERTIQGGRLGLRWQPNDNWTIDATAIYQDVDQDGFGDADLPEQFFAGQSLGDSEQLRFNRDSWEDEWYQLALTVEGNLGFADLMITGAYMNRQTSYEADSTAYLFSWDELKEPGFNHYDFGGDPHAFSTDDSEVDRWSVEARLTTPSDSSSRWSGLLGLFYNKRDNETVFRANVEDLTDTDAWYYMSYSFQYYYLGTLPEDSNNWWHGSYDDTLEQVAVFGEVTFDVTENFSITAGGRWFDIDTDRTLQNGFGVNNPGLLPVNCGVVGPWQDDGIPQEGINCYTNDSPDNSESDFVPKLNVTYRISDDKMVYATYSEGFRRGGSNAAKPISAFGADGPFHDFDSDTLKNYEVGAKTTWADGRLQFNITAYHMVWEDIQVEAEDPTEGLFTLGIINFPEAEIDGFEADFIWLPINQLQLSGTVGYNDAELSEDATLPDPFDVTVESGTRLPVSPEWQISLAAEYTYERQLFGATPFLRGYYTWQDDSVSSLAGIESIEAELAQDARKQDSYGILNVRAGLEGDLWSAVVFVDNATDEYAEQFYNARWVQSRLSSNRPRTVGVTFRRYFGRN